MTHRNYVVVWLGIVALPAFAWYLASMGPLRSLAFNLAVGESAYLTNLRDSQFGCRTLGLRRPQALVLGDSHSYAGWDFAQLERRLGLRVGSCALGGLYTESIPTLLEVVLRASPDASVIILGFSPRMFWDSPSKREQVEHHRRMLTTLTPSATPLLRRSIFGTPLPHDREPDAITRHHTRIESISEKDIETRLMQSQQSIRTLRDWNRRLGESRHAAELNTVARNICDRVRVSGARLWVVHIPESPYLESRYSREAWSKYRQAMGEIARCADHVVLDNAKSYGLGNRHYVNRPMKDDYDYGMWSRATPLTDDYAFDADHLNPVGAAFFTNAALDRLGVR